MKARMALLISMAMLASGCAVERGSLPLSSCRLDASPIATVVPGLRHRGDASEPQAPEVSAYEDQLARKLVAAYRARTGFSEPQAPGERAFRQLILSGGGQWGSFGTGFLHGWARRPGDGDKLPDFDSVTGVSTGALQATLAFLGRDPAAGSGRTFPTALDFPAGWAESPRREFEVDDLEAGYTITKPDTLYRYHGTKGVIRHASAGDLVPLKARMEQIITPETLTAVAREGNDNKRLLNVAIVDWDTGDALSVDMVKLASQLREDKSNFQAVQQCYVNVLLAASSETLAMPPVRIQRTDAEHPLADGTLYYDAGIRFGVFSQQLDAARLAREYLSQERGEDQSDVGSSLYIIANNELRVDPIKQEKRGKYNALDLAGRGREVLVNQVYLMSIERIFAAAKAAQPADTVYFAYVTSDIVKRCRALDEVVAERKALGEGRHFYPRFMLCLRQAGEKRGLEGDWDHPV
jgi:hypothetical protein